MSRKTNKQNKASIAERLKMYVDYCMELDRYDMDPEPRNYSKAIEYAMGYMDASDQGRGYRWLDIFHDDKPAGFLILGYDLPVHGIGLYICEAYILPELRNRGLMTQAVTKRLLKGNKLYLTIYDKNTDARQFWANLLKNAKAELVSEELIDEVAGMSEYVYDVK